MVNDIRLLQMTSGKTCSASVDHECIGHWSSLSANCSKDLDGGSESEAEGWAGRKFELLEWEGFMGPLDEGLWRRAHVAVRPPCPGPTVPP